MGPVNILQGLAQTLSLGLWDPYLQLTYMGFFNDYTTDSDPKMFEISVRKSLIKLFRF